MSATINIPVTAKEIPILLDYYQNRLRDLKVQIGEMELQVKECNSMIQKLKVIEIDGYLSKDETVDYSEKWSWSKKITFALRRTKRPMSTAEIVDYLSRFERELLIDRRKSISSVSSTLSSRPGEFYKIKNDDGGNSYIINEPPEELTENLKVESVFDRINRMNKLLSGENYPPLDTTKTEEPDDGLPF